MTAPIRRTRSLRFGRLLVVAIGWWLAAVFAYGQPTAPNADGPAIAAALQEAIAGAITHAERSVVAIARSAPSRPVASALQITPDAFGPLRIESFDGQTSPTLGTGVIIDPAGLILTQYLVVLEGDRHTVTTVDGNSYPANIKAADPRSGLAVLEVDASRLPAIELGDASQLRKGHFVIAVGNPYAIFQDGEPTASWGTVTNLARKAGSHVQLGDPDVPQRTLHHLGTLVQTDAKLTFSNGGGALINMDGKMVGLTTAATTIAGHEQPAGYAIPIDPVFRRIIDLLQQGREVEYGLLGVAFRDVQQSARSDGTPGVRVQDVYPATPAEQAGLQPNDLITQVGGQPVPDSDRLQLIVGAMPPGERTEVKYERQGRSSVAHVTLAKHAVPGKKVVTKRAPPWRGIHVDYASVFLGSPSEGATSGNPDPEGCVAVRDVEADSPAWKAGVRPGMFISHVGDRRVSTPEEFRRAVADDGGTVGIRLTDPLPGRNRQERDLQPSIPAEDE